MSLANLITEYTGSEHYFFLDKDLKENAETLLLEFCNECKESLTLENMERGLNKLTKFQIPLAVKKKLPSLLREFFTWAESMGQLAAATGWSADLDVLETNFQSKLRDDGSIRGTTHKKNYTQVGRNDPCPCGSMKKFKKCCMKLISG